MLLVTVAAPLFVLGAPGRVLLWALPASARRTTGRVWRRLDRSTTALWHPLMAAGLYAVTLWLWHVPVLYEIALRDPVVHDLQHLSFFATACVFWRVLLGAASRRLHPLGAVFCLFATSLHASALGVLLTMSPRAWYVSYAGTTAAWGLTPLEDQQLAGLIMWMPACLVYALLALAIIAVWLQGQAGPDREERSCA
jgi:cytochrome c oxidase assembly factor CtaG